MKKTNNTQKITGLALGVSALLAPLSAFGEENTGTGSSIFNIPASSSETGTGFLRVDPSVNLRLTHGTDTLQNDLEVGGHDPNDEGFNFQGLEIGANIYGGDHVRAFINSNIFKPDGEEFESEFEEGFIKLIDLPGNLELRAGRMLARFGDQNAKHNHAFDFVNSNAGNIRFLGDEGLAMEGGEISWLLPTAADDILSVSFGSAVPHEEEEGEEDEAAELIEQALPVDDLVVARYQTRFGADDFRRFQVGASFITGENGFGLTTKVYGADVTYSWRENGLERGGRQFRSRTEWIYRDANTSEGSTDENTVNTSLLWEFVESWEGGLRYDWVEGSNTLGLAKRDRISASLAKRVDFGDNLIGIARLQYDRDNLRGGGVEDTLWLQFGFDWGRAEIR